MTRKAIATAACLALTAVLGGCVGVIGNTVTVRDEVLARKPVVIDGRIYVVDVRTGAVMALDPNAAGSASTFTPVIDDDDGP